MRKLLVVLVVLALVAVVLNFAAARVFENRSAAVLQTALRLDHRPRVHVADGFFLPHFLRGHLDAVDVSAGDVRSQGIHALRVRAHLHGISFAPGMLLGRRSDIRVSLSDGEAVIGAAELSRMLTNVIGPSTVEITPALLRIRARRTVLGSTYTALIEGRPSLAKGRLEFDPSKVSVEGPLGALLKDQLTSLFRFSYQLPRLPAGIEPERLTLVPGAIVVAGRVVGFHVVTPGIGPLAWTGAPDKRRPRGSGFRLLPAPPRLDLAEAPWVR